MEPDAAIYGLIGLALIYAIVHFVVIQYKKDYNSRTTYERFITNAGVVGMALLVIGIMMQ